MINKCVKCGICRFQCPVYSIRGNDAFSPKGKITATECIRNDATALFELVDVYRECSLCKHCAKACPGELDIPNLVIHYREKLNKISPCKTYERILTNVQDVGNPYSSSEQPSFHKNGSSTKEVLLFLGCTARFREPEIAKSAINFIDGIGIDYTVLNNERCCGNILYNMGYINEAREVAKRNTIYLNKFRKILTLCPGCYNMLKSYKKTTGAKFEVFHIVELINSVSNRIEKSKEPVYFHVPCHLYNEGGFEDIFSNLISLFEKVTSSLDITKSTKCCGAGGGMLSTNEEYVKNRMRLTLKNIDADTVITSCPFCYMSFKKYSSKNISYITEKIKYNKELEDILKRQSEAITNCKNIQSKKYKAISSQELVKLVLAHKLNGLFEGEKAWK